MKSLLDTLELPHEFGVTLVIVGFILALAPWFAGADFGVLKIPKLTPKMGKQIRVWGPIALLLAILCHVPVIKQRDPDPSISIDLNDAGPIELGPHGSGTLANAEQYVDIVYMLPVEFTVTTKGTTKIAVGGQVVLGDHAATGAIDSQDFETGSSFIKRVQSRVFLRCFDRKLFPLGRVIGADRLRDLAEQHVPIQSAYIDLEVRTVDGKLIKRHFSIGPLSFVAM